MYYFPNMHRPIVNWVVQHSSRLWLHRLWRTCEVYTGVTALYITSQGRKRVGLCCVLFSVYSLLWRSFVSQSQPITSKTIRMHIPQPRTIEIYKLISCIAVSKKLDIACLGGISPQADMSYVVYIGRCEPVCMVHHIIHIPQLRTTEIR